MKKAKSVQRQRDRHKKAHKPHNPYEGPPCGHVIYQKGFDEHGHRYCVPYQVGKVLGIGGFATCHVMKVPGQEVEFAGKAFYKRNPKNKDITKIDKEIELGASLDHPRIVKVYKKLESRDYIIMLMERCYGGSLSKIMKTRFYLTEPEVRFILNQIVDGLIYLKSKKIMHLDLKLSNILLDDYYQVKIADFGLAEPQKDSLPWHKFCGTLSYLCPQMLSNEPLGYEADVWAIGVVVYKLLLGKNPFEGDDLSTVTNSILTKFIDFRGRDKGAVISFTACDLLRKMLEKLPSKRIKLEQIKQHDFLNCYHIPKTVDRRFSILAPSQAYLEYYDRLIKPLKDEEKLRSELATGHTAAYFSEQKKQQKKLRKTRKALIRGQLKLDSSASSIIEPPSLDPRGPIQYAEVQQYFSKIRNKYVMQPEEGKVQQKSSPQKKTLSKQTRDTNSEKMNENMVPEQPIQNQQLGQQRTITLDKFPNEPVQRPIIRPKPVRPKRKPQQLDIDAIRKKFGQLSKGNDWLNQSQMAKIFGVPGVPFIDMPVCRILYCQQFPAENHIMYVTSYGTIGVMFEGNSILYNKEHNKTFHISSNCGDRKTLDITDNCPEDILPKKTLVQNYAQTMSKMMYITDLMERGVTKGLPCHLSMNFVTKFDFSHSMMIYDTIMGDVTFSNQEINETIIFSKPKGRIMFFDAQNNIVQSFLHDKFDELFSMKIVKIMDKCSRWIRTFFKKGLTSSSFSGNNNEFGSPPVDNQQPYKQEQIKAQTGSTGVRQKPKRGSSNPRHTRKKSSQK